MLRTTRKQATNKRARGTAPLRRPGAVAAGESRNIAGNNIVDGNSGFGGLGFGVQHPLCRNDENARLLGY